MSEQSIGLALCLWILIAPTLIAFWSMPTRADRERARIPVAPTFPATRPVL
jgi:hypothetical protein